MKNCVQMKRKIGLKELYNAASQMKYHDFNNWLAKELFHKPETVDTTELTDELFLNNFLGQIEIGDCFRKRKGGWVKSRGNGAVKINLKLSAMNIDRITYDDEAENELDELVMKDVDQVHIERMDNGHIWIALYSGDERIVVNLHTQRNGKIYGRAEING